MRFNKKIIDLIVYFSPYPESRIYGTGKWLRKYGFYPPIIPLCVMTDHAPGERNPPLINSELTTHAPAILYHLASNVELFNKTNKNALAVTYHSPFVYCRKKLGITRSKNASGTLYFLTHGTPNIRDNKTIDSYIAEINELSKKHHPINICVHYNEERNGVAEIYRQAGFTVFCAGEPTDSNFIENFYSILSKHKYVAANHFGSYALYAVEMGIPFLLYGYPPKYHNKGDTNHKQNSEINVKSYYMERAETLFRNFDGEIPTKDQQDFCSHYLGMNNQASRLRVSLVLYYSLAIYILSLHVNIAKKIAHILFKKNA